VGTISTSSYKPTCMIDGVRYKIYKYWGIGVMKYDCFNCDRSFKEIARLKQELAEAGEELLEKEGKLIKYLELGIGPPTEQVKGIIKIFRPIFAKKNKKIVELSKYVRVLEVDMGDARERINKLYKDLAIKNLPMAHYIDEIKELQASLKTAQEEIKELTIIKSNARQIKNYFKNQ